jgi:hypothetical protein
MIVAGWSSAKPKVGNNQKRLNDEIDLFVWPKNKYVKVRFIGPITSSVNVWFEIISSKQKKKVSIPKICLDYNPKTEEFEGDKCPYRMSGVGRPAQFYLTNMIVRDLQEDMPRKLPKLQSSEKKKRNMLGEKWSIKEAGSKSWTPVRAMTVPASLAEKLASLKTLNVVKNKEGKKVEYDVTHAKYGRDLMIKYNPDGAGTAKWEVQMEEKAPLTEEEQNFLLQPLEGLESLKPQSMADAKAEMKRLMEQLADKKSRKSSGGDEDDEDEDDDDDEDDEDDRKSSKSKSKKNKKSSKFDDDEDEDEEDSESDEDDDSDEDEDDEDEDEDEDDSKSAKAKKKSKSKKSKKKSRDDDEESDEDDDEESDEDDDDDEDEDERPSKSKKKAKSKKKSSKTNKKSKKKSRDDDDEDDEESDDDDGFSDDDEF